MITLDLFNLNAVAASWKPCIRDALQSVDSDYLEKLSHSHDWLPGPEKIFNAFSLPVDQVKFVLFGESPYPRGQSANGYAFWDAAVADLWSDSGLSKPVNRATSLRNIIKMLLVAEGLLDPKHTGQEYIAKLDKKNLVQTNHDFFNGLLQRGFLLLNATPVLQLKQVQKDARAWQPFLKYVLDFLLQKKPHVQFILFGNIANTIDTLIHHHHAETLYAEHPYNISFITNQKVLDFFAPLHLLVK